MRPFGGCCVCGLSERSPPQSYAPPINEPLLRNGQLDIVVKRYTWIREQKNYNKQKKSPRSLLSLKNEASTICIMCSEGAPATNAVFNDPTLPQSPGRFPAGQKTPLEAISRPQTEVPAAFRPPISNLNKVAKTSATAAANDIKISSSRERREGGRGEAATFVSKAAISKRWKRKEGRGGKIQSTKMSQIRKAF